ncbi:hypothetical protein BV20DRAFT_1050514 [Pilatotrama ljubarskyi]|nr:hypothetical protein BV20DRAFT_1050514 [Pilatotrama ljubarskyi]
MPPHRALSCYDVLYTVFEHFADSEDSWYDYDASTGHSRAWFARQAAAANRCILARCARVCRAFFHPAVALLWINLDDPSQVFALLRAAPILLKDSQAGDMETLPSQFMQAAWLPERTTRALQYAWRVRAIHGPRKPTIRSKADDCLLPSWVKEQALFPQLRRLRWTQHISESMDLLQVIPPCLDNLHLIFCKTSSAGSESIFHRSPSLQESFVRELIGQITVKAPHLKYLRITTSGDVQESWLVSVGELRALETFDILEPIYCQPTTYPLLRPLATLPNLRHLRLRLPATTMPHVDRNAFPTLRTLTLDAMFAPLSAIPAFLSSISSPHLESLELLNCECATISVHAKLYEITDIVRSKFSPCLRTFVLSMRGVGPVQAYPQPLTKTIEPLLDMHGLTDVRVSIAPEVAVVAASQHDLKKMSEAWPKTTRLHLAYHSSSSSPPLRDLFAIGRQCPELTELILPGIDASTVQADDAQGQQNSAFPCLRTLSLCDAGWNSRIPDPERLAKCLDRLFPAVDWQCPRIASEAWNETIQELVQLRITRLQNRDASF